jgi:hypothetical protein
MKMFKRKVHQHRWSEWSWNIISGGQKLNHRSCKCGAIQRHNEHTGEITIWIPDGVDSGLLDRGIIRKIYEEL